MKYAEDLAWNTGKSLFASWRIHGSLDTKLRCGMFEGTRKVSFAEYVAMQGETALFTSEFEQYLKEKPDRHMNFIRMFKSWWAEKRSQKTEAIHKEGVYEATLKIPVRTRFKFRRSSSPGLLYSKQKKTADFRKRTVKQA